MLKEEGTLHVSVNDKSQKWNVNILKFTTLFSLFFSDAFISSETSFSTR